MKLFFLSLILAVFIQFFAIGLSNAQPTATLQPPPQNFVVDGNIKEWGDSLRYYNAEKKINYALANDKDNLYMAIRINDRSEQTRILKAGITLSVNPKGKKKELYSITFPVNPQGNAPLVIDKQKDEEVDVTQEDRDELKQAMITTLRGIKVEGFKDIEGDMITTSNTYGIQTAINYDKDGYLICEAAIPLKFFHADDAAKSEWAFDFKINGVAKPSAPQGGDQSAGGGGHGGRGGGGGGMGGGGGGRGGHGGGKGNHGGAASSSDPGHDVLFKSEDFWEKFYLAK